MCQLSFGVHSLTLVLKIDEIKINFSMKSRVRNVVFQPGLVGTGKIYIHMVLTTYLRPLPLASN